MSNSWQRALFRFTAAYLSVGDDAHIVHIPVIQEESCELGSFLLQNAQLLAIRRDDRDLTRFVHTLRTMTTVSVYVAADRPTSSVVKSLQKDCDGVVDRPVRLHNLGTYDTGDTSDKEDAAACDEIAQESTPHIATSALTRHPMSKVPLSKK